MACILVEIRLLPHWLAAFEQARKYRHSKDICVKDTRDRSDHSLLWTCNFSETSPNNQEAEVNLCVRARVYARARTCM